MQQEFINDKQTLLNRDDQRIVRDVIHFEKPITITPGTINPRVSVARQAAAEYLLQNTDTLQIDKSTLERLNTPPEEQPVEEEQEGFRFLEEKQQFDITTVAYYQTYFGLPVWQSGVSIQMQLKPLPNQKKETSPVDTNVVIPEAFEVRVLSAQFTGKAGLKVGLSKRENVQAALNLSPEELTKLLGLTESDKVTINQKRLFVYMYEQKDRLPEHKEDEEQAGFKHDHPTLPLPKVAPDIVSGQHYVVLEVLFTLTQPEQMPLNWQALIEVNTLSVLYLRALIDNVNGLVFQSDPITRTGNPANGPAAAAATLDLLRENVNLIGLVPPLGGIQTLTGNYVRVVDFEPPTINPPTEISGANFNYLARTNNFAAVNAYFNCDRFFRLIGGMGFNLGTYFNGTTFPIPIDHRGKYASANGIEINAYCAGNALNNGIGRSGYMLANLADTVNPISIAADWRVVLHEFGGHGILWDHVNSPNFGFAHSAGDSVAVILNDPDTNATDRFDSFPWTFSSLPVSSRRRHDRNIASGWGWGGSNDTGGYNSEQILSTTLFRLYRSMGGDSTDVNRRRFAARYAVYLIFRAVGLLTPATNSANASSFATTLMTADQGDWTTEGHAGGAYGKVIRWAFEKQGAYRAPGTPATSPGAPPFVDVYIQDGRNGEYPYQAVHWNNQSIWNRRANDGQLVHEEPIVGVTNYAYVKIKNRGTQTATNVVVKGYHCNPGTGLIWPTSWQPMTTAQLPAPNIAPNNAAEIIVGPFQWTPSQLDHECMLMIVSAAGDPSNVNNFTAGDTIPEWRLVPHDNNIGQRNVAPVAGGGGATGLLKSFENRRFFVNNPFKATVKIELKVTLPSLLSKKGWQLAFADQGQSFTLDVGQKREVLMYFVKGEEFTPEEVRAEERESASKAAKTTGGEPISAEVKGQENLEIIVESYANEMLIGGMTYLLDPSLQEAGRGIK